MAKYVMTFCFFLAMSTVQVANSEAGMIIIDGPDTRVNQSCDKCFHLAGDVTGNIQVVGPNATLIANNVDGNISATGESKVIVKGTVQGDVTITGASVIVCGRGESGVEGKVTNVGGTLGLEDEACGD